jgi:hypothetical protein
MKILNDLEIVWTVEVEKNNNFIFNHHPNRESVDGRIKPKKGSKVYIITDKQFGLIKITFDGSIPKLEKPFKKSLLFSCGQMKQLIPLTSKQFNNSIQY